MNTELKLKLFSLAESLGDIGHWWIEADTQSLYWSDQTYVIHGVDRQSYTPTLKTAIEFYHHDDRERVMDVVNTAIKNGDDFEFSLRIIQPTGKICHVLSKAECEKDTEGNITHIFGIFRDVTKEFTAQQTAKRTQHAHTSLIESSTDGFWDWYIQTGYQYMSPRFWEMFGYLPSEKPHKPSAWQDLIFPEDLEVAKQNLQKHFDSHGEHPYLQEVRYKHKNGSTVTVLCRGKVIDWDKNGQPIRMVGTHTDMTIVQTAQEQLRKNLYFQQLLINSNTDLIFVKDIEFRIVTANNAFLSLYPEDMRESIIGTTTLEKYDREEAELFLKEDRQAFKEGRSEIIETLTFPDGKIRTMQTIKTRFIDIDKSPMILCVARDITKLKKVESDLLEANDELEEFAYRTSHDLRSPLLSTQRLLTFIAKDFSNNKMANIYKNIQLAKDTLHGLEVLVSDILTLSRLQNAPPTLIKIHFQEMIESILNNLRHMENFDNINISYNIDVQQDVYLQKDNTQQILQNVISNAIKYQDLNKEQSMAHIDIHRTNDYISLSISDNGLGIPEENRGQLFSMFKRFHNKVSYGSGLGLYMLKKSVKKMNGEINFKPLQDGSCFTVLLPIITKEDMHNEKN